MKDSSKTQEGESKEKDQNENKFQGLSQSKSYGKLEEDLSKKQAQNAAKVNFNSPREGELGQKEEKAF